MCVCVCVCVREREGGRERERRDLLNTLSEKNVKKYSHNITCHI